MKAIDRKTIIFVAAVTALRMVITSRLGLHPDEAYYWLWSGYPDFGYYDHPPMFAYFIRVATLLLGDSLFAVRLPALLSGIVISFSVYNIARILFPEDKKIPFWSVVLLNVMPLTASGILITPDVPSLLFWSLSMWLFATMVDLSLPTDDSGLSSSSNRSYPSWLLLGILSGLGLLSKYTSVLFPVCAAFYLVISVSADDRRILLTPQPYLALVTAILIFSPVIFWNAAHNWISFAFQLRHGAGPAGGAPVNLANFFNFIGAQVASGGIFPTVIGISGGAVFLFLKNNPRRFLSAMTLPVFVLFGFAALKSPGEANWTAPAYIGVSIIVSSVVFRQGNKNLWSKIISTLTIALPAILTLTLYLQAAYRIIHFEDINPAWLLMEPTNRFYGWREFTDYMLKISDGKPIIAPDHQSAALLLYYAGQSKKNSASPDTHQTFHHLEIRAGTNNFIFYEKFTAPVDGKCFTFDYTTDVNTGPVDFSKFSDVKEAGVFESERDGVVIRRYRIYECRNFSGFARN